MPRQRSTQPAYQFHVSGQARVTLGGIDFYLGIHGSPESYARYYALLAEYNANGRQPPKKDLVQVIRQSDLPIRVRDITADFRTRVLPNYEHNEGHHCCYRRLCELLEERHADEPAADFGPRKLEAIRDILISRGNCRRFINNQIARVIRIFEHGVSRELLAPDRIVALRSLPSLRRGQAKDHPKRGGVALETIRATLAHLSSTAASMVELQLLTAMRPSELFRMTPADVDRSKNVWIYRPSKHKTEHHGKLKTIPIVGDAVRVLSPFLFGEADRPCFLTSKGTPWNKDSYRIAVTRAARAANVQHWTPYALRHSAAQAVRDAVGIEAASALLGHSRLDTTQIYAQASEARAIEAASHTPKLSKVIG